MHDRMEQAGYMLPGSSSGVCVCVCVCVCVRVRAEEHSCPGACACGTPQAVLACDVERTNLLQEEQQILAKMASKVGGKGSRAHGHGLPCAYVCMSVPVPVACAYSHVLSLCCPVPVVCAYACVLSLLFCARACAYARAALVACCPWPLLPWSHARAVPMPPRAYAASCLCLSQTHMLRNPACHIASITCG